MNKQRLHTSVECQRTAAEAPGSCLSVPHLARLPHQRPRALADEEQETSAQPAAAAGSLAYSFGQVALSAARTGLLQRAASKEEPIGRAPAPVHEMLHEAGQPLDASTRAYMEPRFGYNFGQVRIHTNRRAAEAAQAINALAYTTGNTIVFGHSQYAPETRAGRTLLAHELTHIVQQDQASPGEALTIGPASDHLEQEAEAISTMVTAAGATASPADVQGQASPAPAAIVRTVAARTIQRQPATSEAPPMSMTPDYVQGLSDDQLRDQVDAVRTQLSAPAADSGLQDNLTLLEAEVSRRTQEAQDGYMAAYALLLAQEPYLDPATPAYVAYAEASRRLITLGMAPQDELQGTLIPEGQLLTVNDTQQFQLLADANIANVGDDLFPVLDAFAAASQGADPPIMGGDMQQVTLWDDGRAVLGPATSTDLATLFLQGQPVDVDAATTIANLDVPWTRVRDSSVQGVLSTGVYLLDSYPLSSFNGIALPPNARIRFRSEFGRVLRGNDSQLVTIFEKGTNRFYAWDAHMPVGGTPHDFYHYNQKGMAKIFGNGLDHAALPPSRLAAARGIRYLKIGGKVFLVVGIVVDGALLINSIGESIDQGTPRPVIAQAVRTIGGWAGAWAGAKLLCVGGGTATIETGPGAVLGCIAGGVVGGFAGYFAADWIADMIEE